jgi:periplasmic protein TonB
VAKDINLNSAEWCSLVFEGKNQQYGAFRQRQSSGKRHRAAMIIVLIGVIFIALLPTLVKTIQKLRPKHEVFDETRQMADVKLEDMVKEDQIKYTPEPVEIPPLKTTLKYTELEITDEPIDEGEELRAMDDVVSSKTAISVADVKGDDDVNGVDIADLEDHQVMAEDPVFSSVEELPQFPGGDAELMRFISDNLKYPTIAQEMCVEGKVIVRFVVSKTGEVSNIIVARSIDASCDKEAVRVIQMMPKWIPGRQNGKAVNVYFSIPIVFRLKNQ